MESGSEEALAAAWVAAKGLAVAAAVPCQVDAKVLRVVATAAAATVRVGVATAEAARARAKVAVGASEAGVRVEQMVASG